MRFMEYANAFPYVRANHLLGIDFQLSSFSNASKRLLMTHVLQRFP